MKLSIVVPLAPQLKINPRDLNIPEDIETILVPGLNTSANRNLGIKKAQTELVAFINGHTILTDNWVQEVHKFFEKYPEIDIVGGPQLGWKNDNSFAKASSIALGSKFGAGEVSSRYKSSGSSGVILNADETYLGSWCLVCRRKVFDKVLFDETLYPGEDPKFISDAQKVGFKIAYSPDIIVYNKKRGTILGLVKQMFSYGTVRPKKEPLSETIKHPTFLIPSLFVLYLVAFVICSLFLPGSFYKSIISWIVPGPLLIYLLAIVLFSFFESRDDIFLAFPMVLVFPIIHISYGCGFLYGTLKNERRN